MPACSDGAMSREPLQKAEFLLCAVQRRRFTHRVGIHELMMFVNEQHNARGKDGSSLGLLSTRETFPT